MPRLHVRHERHQHAVGHGFFHTASVHLVDQGNSFEYVYDVGAKKRSEVLAPIVDEYASLLGARAIDMVVLSHLHDDHVSGLDRLLLNCKVRTVVLPYVDPVEKLILVAATIVAGNADASAVQFAMDARTWLTTRGVDRVLEISPGPPGQESNPDQQAADAPPDVPPPDWRLTKGKPTTRNADPGEPASTETIPHGTPLILGLGTDPVWEFKFFCYRDAELWEEFATEVARLFKVSVAKLPSVVKGTWVLEQLRSNPLARSNLTKAYAKVVGKGRLNWTSLCLWSGPGTMPDRVHWATHEYAHGGTPGKRKASDDEGRVAWLGTGDAELSDPAVADALVKHYAPLSARYRLASMALPHHGSKHNYNAMLLRELDPVLVYATCPEAKEGVTQKHPAPEVERQVAKWRGMPLMRIDQADANGLHEWVRVYAYP